MFLSYDWHAFPLTGFCRDATIGRMTTSPQGEDARQASDSPPMPSAIPLDTFANRLMLVRAHAGNITIKKAAEMCGLNYGSWSNWERGSRPQDIVDVVERISEGLGIDAQWLLLGGPLAEPEARSRRARWSAIRPTHAPSGAITNSQYHRRAVRPPVITDRTGPDVISRKPHGDRPKGRGAGVAPPSTLRRPVRTQSASATK